MSNLVTIGEKEYDVEMVRRHLFDLMMTDEITKAAYDRAIEMLREDRPLTNILDQLVQDLGGIQYDPAHPFGGLPEIPEAQRRKPGATSETCYICQDPEFAAYGLPLCRACPACGGHIAADDTRCDDCGLSDRWFWEVERELRANGNQSARDLLKHCFEDKNYDKAKPTPDQLNAAVAAVHRVLDEQREARDRDRPSGG